MYDQITPAWNGNVSPALSAPRHTKKSHVGDRQTMQVPPTLNITRDR